jgi:hypothetical protein
MDGRMDAITKDEMIRNMDNKYFIVTIAILYNFR